MNNSRANDAYNEAVRLRKIFKEAKLEFEKNNNNFEELERALYANIENALPYSLSNYKWLKEFHYDSVGELRSLCFRKYEYLIRELSNLDEDCFNIIRMAD